VFGDRPRSIHTASRKRHRRVGRVAGVMAIAADRIDKPCLAGQPEVCARCASPKLPVSGDRSMVSAARLST